MPGCPNYRRSAAEMFAHDNTFHRTARWISFSARLHQRAFKLGGAMRNFKGDKKFPSHLINIHHGKAVNKRTRLYEGQLEFDVAKKLRIHFYKSEPF